MGKRPKQPSQDGEDELTTTGPKARRISKPEISELRRQIIILKRALSEWDTAFNSIVDLISIHDKDFHITRVNKAFADTVGVESEKLVGKRCFEIFHGTDEPHPDCPHMQILKSGKPLTAEYWEPHLKGYFQIACSPILNEKNEIIGSVHIAKNITAQRQAEIERESLILQLRVERLKAEELASEARRRAEEAEEGKRTLDTLMAHVPAGIMIVDANLRIEYLSYYPQFLTGTPSQRFIGVSLDIITPYIFHMDGIQIKPEDLPLSRAVRRGEVVVDEELILRAENGERFIILVNAGPIRDSGGNIIGGLSAWNDITTLKRVQATVQNQADELNAIIISMADGVIVFDGEGRVHRTNPRLRKIYGFDPAEGSMHFSDFLPNAPHMSGQSLRLEETPPYRALHGETVINFPVKLRNRLGKDLFIQVSASPIYREGRIMGAVAILHDITREETLRQELERNHSVLKSINEKLETQSAALKHSRDELEQKVRERTADLAAMNIKLMGEMEERRQTEEKYRQLVANAPVGIYEVELPNFKIISVNEAMCEIMGYTREEFLSLDPALFLTEESRKVFAKRRKKFVAGERVTDSVEYGLLTKNGRVIRALINNRIFYENGRPVRATVIAHDITERKHYEAALLESEKRLQLLSSQLIAAQENERKLVAQELHDSIGSNLSAIKHSLETKLHQIGREGVTCGISFNEVMGLLQHTMDENRRIQLNLRPSILDDLGILSTIAWFSRETRKAYPSVSVEQSINIKEEEVPEELKIVVFRIIQESISNAIRHGKANLVRIGLERRGPWMRLMVEDNGIGFESAFKKDFLNGGMGLESMQQRVDTSRGVFSIRSTPGKGTIVKAEWTLN